MIPASELTPEKVKTRPKAKNPVKICDITLRDGHQSLLATRMRTEDMEFLADELNKCGFYAMEVWEEPPSMSPIASWVKTPGRDHEPSRSCCPTPSS